jgi:hypothetical protein
LLQQPPPQTGQWQTLQEVQAGFAFEVVVATTAPADNTMTARLKITFFMIDFFRN